MPGRTTPLSRPVPAEPAGTSVPIAGPGRDRSPIIAALASFLVVLGAVLLRNRMLFSTAIHEVGDSAADSLLVDDAKHVHLLVGHYSRVGFHHPGPAVLYIKAAGEALFTDLLGLTPAPYNGQLLATLILEAAVVAAVAGIVQSWTRRWPATAAVVAAVLVWYGAHPFALTSTWMPLLDVPPFLLLIVSAASVAAGRRQHLWLLAGSAGLLVHSHVAFALFAPVLVVAAIIGWAATGRLGPRALWRAGGRHWLAALGVTLLFAAPIALNTVLHWPGEIPKYLTYSQNTPKIHPTVDAAVLYARAFWTPYAGKGADLIVAGLFAAAAVAGLTAPRPLRRPLLALTGAAALAEALFLVYALKGIDDLHQAYVGYFSWSVPLALIIAIAVGILSRVPTDGLGATAVAAVATGLVAYAVQTHGLGLRPEDSPTLPNTVRAVEQAVAGAPDRRPVVLDIGPGIGPFIDGTGLLLNLERADIKACVADPGFRVQVTSQRICTSAQLQHGRTVTLRETAGPVPPTVRDHSDITVTP